MTSHCKPCINESYVVLIIIRNYIVFTKKRSDLTQRCLSAVPTATMLVPKCLGSTTIKNSLHFQCRDRLNTSDSHVYKRQILTAIVDPRAERVMRIYNCAGIFTIKYIRVSE